MGRFGLYFMIVPALLLIVAVVIAPLGVTVYLSLHHGTPKTAIEIRETERLIFGGVKRKVIEQSLVPVVTPYGTYVQSWTFAGLENFDRATDKVEARVFGRDSRANAAPVSEADGTPSTTPEIVQNTIIETAIDLWNTVSPLVLSPLAQVALASIGGTLLTLPIALALGFYLALSVRRLSPGVSGWLAALIILPFFLPTSIGVSVLIGGAETGGLLESIVQMTAHLLGVDLSQGVETQLVLIAYTLWRSVPLIFLIFFVGLAAIPESALAAAKVDGVGARTRKRLAVTPYTQPITSIAAVAHVALSLGSAEQYFVPKIAASATTIQLLANASLLGAGNGAGAGTDAGAGAGELAAYDAPLSAVYAVTILLVTVALIALFAYGKRNPRQLQAS